MSYVDAPLHSDPTGGAIGEIAAPPRLKTVTRVSLIVVTLCLTATIVVSMGQVRNMGGPIALLVVAWTMCWLGFAVRSATIVADDAGIVWGFSWLRIRLRKSRLRKVTVYTDSVAFKPKRGSTWHVSRKDWTPFDCFCQQLVERGFPLEQAEGPTPWLGKVQTYGWVLNVSVIAAAGFSVLQVLWIFASLKLS